MSLHESQRVGIILRIFSYFVDFKNFLFCNLVCDCVSFLGSAQMDQNKKKHYIRFAVLFQANWLFSTQVIG